MSYSRSRVADQSGRNSEAEEYALEELRRSITVPSDEPNPFKGPFESKENIEAPFEDEEEELNYARTTKHPRHPYMQFNSNVLDTQKSHAKPRQHSRINLLTPPKSPIPNAPLIICLHGSNDSCMRSWLGLVEVLYKSGHRVLLYDRPSSSASHGIVTDLKPHRAVSELCSYLYSMELHGPFVFVAHSYGGCIARLFLQQQPREVAGLVLVEAGHETILALDIEEQQYKRQILDNAPLSVIRGNTLRAKQDEWVKAFDMARTDAQKAQLEPQRLELERWAIEDHKVKEKQLQLSKRSRLCQVAGVGEHVVRDKPEAVLEEVKWVMQEIAAAGVTVGVQPMVKQSQPSYKMGYGSGGITSSVVNVGAGMKRGLGHKLKRPFSKKEAV